MFKTISAALLAVSVLAAPAFAATTKMAQAPASKTTTTETKATPAATTPAKDSAVNTKMSTHHRKVVRHHQRYGKLATKPIHHARVSVKHAAPTSTKRS